MHLRNVICGWNISYVIKKDSKKLHTPLSGATTGLLSVTLLRRAQQQTANGERTARKVYAMNNSKLLLVAFEFVLALFGDLAAFSQEEADGDLIIRETFAELVYQESLVGLVEAAHVVYEANDRRRRSSDL